MLPRLLAFASHAASYMCAAWIELPYYLFRRGRYNLLAHYVVNIGCFFG